MELGTRILLVKGNRSIAGFAEPELERLGFDVRCAYDGTSSLEEVRRFGLACSCWTSCCRGWTE